MSNKSSVAVEDSETIRDGRAVSVTVPAPVLIVTGKVCACTAAAAGDTALAAMFSAREPGRR